MRLTLIRHGAADDHAVSDEERALTNEGRATVRRVGKALARRRVRFDAIVSSPLVRAVQTAEIVAASVGHKGDFVVDRALVPEARPQGVLALLEKLGAERVALVAHEPIMSSLASVLTGRRFRGFAKGEAVRIRMDEGLDQHGSLRWSIDPATGKLVK